jgi:hypothetical protein
MKAIFLSFVFICFSELGLFNGLWSIQIRKIPSGRTHVSGCTAIVTQLFLALPCTIHIVKALFPTNQNDSTMLRFFQINVPPFSGLSSPSRERVFWTYAHDRLSASPPHGPEPIRTFNWMGLLNEAEDLA